MVSEINRALIGKRLFDTDMKEKNVKGKGKEK